MNAFMKQVQDLGIIPVVKIDRASDAVPLAKALIDGGLPVAEVTFRTEAAGEAIAEMCKAYPDMLVGAGTVLTTAQVDAAVKAGAKFIVSPGLNPKVVSYCKEFGIPVIPGVNNPSQIEQALELGLEVVKFFPAEASGGLAMIKAMSAPYGQLWFMPTGGINAANLKSYLDFNKILACGGSWMVKGDMINAGDFAGITALTKEAVRGMLGFGVKHIGINSADEAEAKKTAELFATIFGFDIHEIPISYFCGTGVEVMKYDGEGRLGHIAVATNYMDRAIAYLERKGIELDYDSVMLDDKGKIKLIYLKQDFGGFAVHLARW